ncbi:MAG: exodeoxyribonuclease VII small subunit [Ruminococcus sp.]|nr:exodeoxyribonuclease VII small subunit [Ruminococcus sp.]
MTELNDNMDFEQAYAALREIVTQLEDPKNKIEDTIALYEKACRLVLLCRRKLDDARMQITDVNERIKKLKSSGTNVFED